MSNPYQSPQMGGRKFVGPSAAERLNVPAIALMVTSALFIVVLALLIVLYIVLLISGQAAAMANERLVPAETVLIIRSCVAVVLILFNAFIFYGAQQMRTLESYSMAMAAAIIACIPCCGPCYLLGIPFGIWSIVVLTNDEVKRAFRS